MASFKSKFDSNKQDWTTPRPMFDALHKDFNFTLDAAASPENALTLKYFTEQDDAILQNWGQNTVWLNPPYGKPYGLSKWVEKAYVESTKGATVVMLIPARTNTEWFHKFCLRYAEVRFIRGRPKFGNAKYGLPQPLCLVIFRPK